MQLILGIVAIIFAVFVGIPSTEYGDMAWAGKHRNGSIKNSTSAIVAGIIGQQIYGHSQVSLVIQKFMWADADLIGYTTDQQIKTAVDLTFSHSNFIAEKDSQGQLKGKVDKGGLDWEVIEIRPSTYKIVRQNIEFDMEMTLTVRDGQIAGNIQQLAPWSFDWEIAGTYDEDGNVNIEIDGPMTLAFSLVGKILDTSESSPEPISQP